ncbi:eukaryotic and archaeal DNA primase, large subunit-domain-containing protein [Gongronella butleri]|nr:eukaryotic and archaeal DNA primase, large subunit-domain-containing protein [Gongronella butleri]
MDVSTTSSTSTSSRRSSGDDMDDDVETAMTTPTTTNGKFPGSSMDDNDTVVDTVQEGPRQKRAYTNPSMSTLSPSPPPSTASSNDSSFEPLGRPRAMTFDQQQPMIATTFRPSDFYRMRQRAPSFASHEAKQPQNQDTTQDEPEKKDDADEQQQALEELRHSLDPDAYDWEFWSRVIGDFDTVRQDAACRQKICVDMPPSLRGTLWLLFSKSQLKHDHYDAIYRELLERTSPHEKMIRRDLARTFPAHTFFRQRDGDGQELLFNVIKAYSLFDPELGYCQGLLFIVGCLLLHMPDEASFCLLIHLMHDYGLRGHFTPKMERLHERLYQLDQLLHKHLPEVHRHMEAQGVAQASYATSWFLTLFAYRCPLSLVFHVLDMVFIEGSAILLNVALALLKKSQTTILSLEFEPLLAFLSTEIFEPYQDDAASLVQDAFAFELAPKELEKLAKQHRRKAAKEAKFQSKEDHWRQQNHELTQRVRHLERAHQQLETDHGTLAKEVIESKMAMARASEANHALKRELATLKQTMDSRRNELFQRRQHEFDAVAQENTALVQRHALLQDQLADVEATLIDFKLKYAQSETEFEQMKSTLVQSRKTGVNRFAAVANRRIAVDRDSALDASYPTRLNLYEQPPGDEITIEEFELYALDRLQVLKAIETAKLRNLAEDQFKKDVQAALDKYMPMHSNAAKVDLYKERRKDHISHFVLRLAYCRSDESREWFLRQETALFRFRFEQEMTEDKKIFLDTAKMGWSVVDTEKKQELLPFLMSCAPSGIKINVEAYVNSETFFEVPFEKVPDLVRRRGVHLSMGKAYVPMSHQTSLVMDEFTSRLNKMLDITSKALPRLEEDDRLKPILLNVEKQYSGKIYGGSTEVDGELSAANVDGVVERHAPLCMRSLHDALNRDNHLRHFGRMQFGLFLKAIGLSVDQALLYWRMAFSKMTDEQFQKGYAYNIRHNYGLEGRRVSYEAYSCNKIIKGQAPSTGDYHGCPFRHFSSGNLEARLYKDKLLPNQVRDIMDLVGGSHYQLACTKYYEYTHPSNANERIDTIEHPNAYYELSVAAANDDQENEPMDVER